MFMGIEEIKHGPQRPAYFCVTYSLSQLKTNQYNNILQAHGYGILKFH